MMSYKAFHAGGHEDHAIRQLWKGCPEKGVFVDVGAGDPVDMSNSYHFERNGWDGLLIDAHPQRVEQLRRWRTWPTVAAAIGTVDDVVTFYLAGHIDHSSLLAQHTGNGKPFNVVGRKLETALLQFQIGHIDILSIDVEGSELAVWRSMRFEAHRPTCVIIEHDKIGCDVLLQEFFPLGYRLLVNNTSNLIFLASGET